MNSVVRPSRRIFFAYLIPGLIIYSFVILIPIISAFRYSFFDWTGGPNMKFIGLKNYITLLGDKSFWLAFKNNVIMIVLALIVEIGGGFVFSMLLHSKLVKFRNLHRTMCYFPSTLAPVIVAFIWMLMYNYSFGLINAVFEALGLESFVLPWLDMYGPIMIIVTIPLLWQMTGYYVIILLAGLSSISKEVLEMAEIDGATGLKKAVYITMPMMKRVIMVCVTLCIAMNMRGFENVYIMTGGGPGDASMIVALYAYKASFLKYNFGYGSTISIGIIVLSLILILGSQYLAQINQREGV